MAEVTNQLWNLEGVVQLYATFDDVTGDLDSFRLVTSQTIPFKIILGNGSAWKSLTVAPGDYTYPAIGPVRNWDDISRLTTELVY
jgi:hypothetical protein